MAWSAKAGGKKGAVKARKARPVQGRSPKAQARRSSAAKQAKAVLDPPQTIAELRRELDKARAGLAARDTAYSERIAYQAATNDVLKMMSVSPGDPQPVFDLIVERARDLCDGYGATLYQFDGTLIHWRAATGVSDDPLKRQAVQSMFPMRPTREWPAGHAIIDRMIIHIRDLEAEPALTPAMRGLTVRSAVVVPMMRGDLPMGALSLGSRKVGGFAEAQVELLKTFADQAVIAIENARLFNEVQTKSRALEEALQQQTATSEVLQVINSSPSDLAPVFDAMLVRAMRLCDAAFGGLWLVKDEQYFAVALRGVPPAYAKYLESATATPGPNTAPYRFLHGERSAIQHEDLAAEEPYLAGDPQRRALVDVGRARTALQAPLVQNDRVLGVITIYRQEVKSFSEKQVALLENFAAQAVVAIENARLFNETKEALERQTATADILKVIASSPSDVQPVFEAIVSSAAKLFEPCAATITTLRDGRLHWDATAASISGFDVERTRGIYPLPFDPERSPSARAISECRIIAFPDVAAPETPEFTRNAAAAGGFRSITFVPLVDQEQGIGTIIFTHPQAGFRFSDRQLALVQTFASQAVIAIENARLFNETQEALARQTGTADVLKVIASSPSNLQPVFDAIAERSKALIGGHSTTVVRYVNGIVALASFTPVSPEADATLLALFPMQPDTDPQFAPILRGEIALITDAESELQNTAMKDSARARGWRSRLLVPLKDDTGVIGWISITRKEAGGFAEKDVELLQTFADQAVIAIQNVKLFEEVQVRTRDLQESLEQQTATSEVLQVISSSSGELDPVFNKMLENATRICGARFGTMTLYEERGFRTVALYNAPKAYADTQLYKVIRPHPESGLSAVQKTREPVHIADIRKEPPYVEGNPHVRALADLGGARTIIIVPMLRDNELVGTITIYRQEVKPFTEKQTEVVANFANQAVIAIENARLLNELRERTEELSQSLDDLRAAQDRLVQTEKLASLGQLTAGIAHEIKNPLNFVNNFSALSVELTDELRDVLKQETLTDKGRSELDELTGLLHDNLGKVVQHGKRADSIVKNMLLHSREGSGERRSADINALVGESLNLAYHGARAEKSGFAITLKHDLDPNAGALELYPQEITRALLNLISNGFYAATKRKGENSDGDFEPVLSAATRNLGETVEIRIRDNGTGIPPDVREKMFNPFFTTKPTGEGTGLGLSMTHDIVVKQHGGRIDVETEPGTFTEFIITLPRGQR